MRSGIDKHPLQQDPHQTSISNSAWLSFCSYFARSHDVNKELVEYLQRANEMATILDENMQRTGYDAFRQLKCIVLLF